MVFLRRARQTAFRDAARVQISLFEDALKYYETHIRNYPSTNQSLQALIERPSGLPNQSRWQGPYLDVKVLPLDPWDQPYRYELADRDTYRIWSVGPDGAEGTEDDISSQ
jgi:general secretion pathway protein G